MIWWFTRKKHTSEKQIKAMDKVFAEELEAYALSVDRNEAVTYSEFIRNLRTGLLDRLDTGLRRIEGQKLSLEVDVYACGKSGRDYVNSVENFQVVLIHMKNQASRLEAYEALLTKYEAELSDGRTNDLLQRIAATTNPNKWIADWALEIRAVLRKDPTRP